MKRKLTPIRVFSLLTGLLFAAYAAYNVFIIIRDYRVLPPEGVPISVLVASLFGVLAIYAWTAGVAAGSLIFVMIRRTVYIIALALVFLLKLRLIGRAILAIDFSQPPTVLYAASFFATLLGLLVLLAYSVLFHYHPMLSRGANISMPVIAALLFLCALVFEAILFFVYHIGMEANLLRTMVIRPVFYLGFIGLCVCFMVAPPVNEPLEYVPPADDELVMSGETPADEDYLPPDNDVLLVSDEAAYEPPEGAEYAAETDFVIPDNGDNPF